jgi:lysophospholipase L1-like esterase
MFTTRRSPVSILPVLFLIFPVGAITAQTTAPAPPSVAAAPLPPSPVPNGGAEVPTAPQVAFPGQYAPPHGDRLRPSNPKACRTLDNDARLLTCFQNVAFDWPGLARFAAANRELAAPAPRERRVVFFGDSITDNWSRQSFGGFFPGKPYVNRGIGGQTTGQMLARFRPDVIALKPRAVVILAGTNDVSGNVGPLEPETIQGYLTSLAELARLNGIKVVLASLLPVRDGVLDSGGKPILLTGDRPPATLLAINRWIGEYAKRNRHVFLDYHAAMIDQAGALKPELTYDGLHPNAKGYAAMGTLAEAALVKAIGR